MIMKGWQKAHLLVISLALLVLMGIVAETALAKPDEFYKGKTIEFTSPSVPGGSIYSYITAIVPFIEKYTGARVVVTVKRKGGGLEGYSHVYRSKPDGLHMGAGSSLTMLLNEIFESPGCNYNSEKFNFIGAAMPDRLVMMVNPSGPYQTIEALQKTKDLKFGVTSPRGNYSTANVAVMYLLDLDAKQILGYQGSSRVRLAILQGEIAACCFSSAEALRPDVGTKPLFVLGTKRDPEMPDVPALSELVELKGDKMVVNKWYDKLRNAKVWYLPPGVDKDKVEYLRQVHEKICKDPNFIDKSEQLLGRNFRVEGILVSGEEFQKEVEETINNKKMMQATFLPLFEKYTIVK